MKFVHVLFQKIRIRDVIFKCLQLTGVTKNDNQREQNTRDTDYRLTAVMAVQISWDGYVIGR